MRNEKGADGLRRLVENQRLFFKGIMLQVRFSSLKCIENMRERQKRHPVQEKIREQVFQMPVEYRPNYE